MICELEFNPQPPFDARVVFEFLAARAITGVEQVTIEQGTGEHRASVSTTYTYARTLHAPSGPAAVTLRYVEPHASSGRGPQEPTALSATVHATSQRDIAPFSAAITALFDLDAPSPSIDAALAGDPALAPLVHARPGTRVPGALDPAELVIRAIVGQQITVAAARGHLARLALCAGSPAPNFPGIAEELTTLFPTPAQIVAAVPHIGPADDLDPERPLRLPRRQSNAVRAAALALAAGDLDLRGAAGPGTLARQLAALPGVGPWTAAYVAMRVQRDPDSWMLGDVALVAGARAIRLLPDVREGSKHAEHRALAARAVEWAPWRSYASMHLWRAAAESSTRNPPR